MAADLDRLAQAKEHADAKQYDKAWPILTDLLYEEPNDPHILTVVCSILDKQGNAPLAYQVARRLVEMVPRSPTTWINLGKTADGIWRYSESENSYNRALTLVAPQDDYTKASIYNNLSAVQVQNGDFKKGLLNAERALKIEPTFRRARHNLGISQLALGNWAGWENYAESLGSDHRVLWKYNDEPTWKGETDGTVVIFGEQGIGDEICAASMVDDAIKVAKKVILDCDQRLAPLFARSFPLAKVYGTRTKKVLNWAEEDTEVNYSIAAMQLGGIFRRDGFPEKRAYLQADPERVGMWKSLWREKGKPAVGIAWTGGVRATGQQYRALEPAQLEPFRKLDCHLVSLQYKGDSVVGLHEYQYATRSQDYDDTAALVASLDAVVGVPTSVVHLSGALGVETVAMKAKVDSWGYHAGLPFHKAHLVEHNGWKTTVDDSVRLLRKILYE